MEWKRPLLRGVDILSDLDEERMKAEIQKAEQGQISPLLCPDGNRVPVRPTEEQRSSPQDGFLGS